MKYVGPQDVEKINKIAHHMRDKYYCSWRDIAQKTEWSITTVRKYYDKNWFPGKYYQEPIEIENINKELDYTGIYLMGQQIYEEGAIIHLIKVGKAINIRNRLSAYRTHNPFAKLIDTKKYDIKDLDKIEKTYHNLLGIKNKRYGNTEWFVCSEEEYNKWLKQKLYL